MENTKEPLRTLLPLNNKYYGTKRKRLMGLVNNVAEQMLSLKKIKEKYEIIPPCDDPFQFLKNALKALQIGYRIDDRDIKAIPSSGSVIVVSNHPFGGIDGIILAHFLSTVRKDFKILVNYFLHAIPDLRPLFLAVDPFGSKNSTSRNITSMNRAVRWVKNGGMLVVFPAGEVSHLKWGKLRVSDPQWSTTVARLIRLTKAPVVPVYFKGRNSNLFQIAGLAHPRMRTVMLPREMLKKTSSEVQFKVGSLIPFRTMSTFSDSSYLTEYLRFRTHLLGVALRKDSPCKKFRKAQKSAQRKGRNIAPPQNALSLANEVNLFPNDQKLVEANDLTVYYARASQIQKILQEIGRLRETTFRSAGEGTGRSIDLDRFDNIYLHLFVWNNKKKEIVGAYRLGPTDEILPRHGKKGLYTNTLFKYRGEFLQEMGPALEMGRTFIRAEYQKSYAPLLLLWKGIGQYVALNPRYKVLFGAVSISNEYRSYSRQLMVTFLKINKFSSDLSKMVKPRKPFRRKKIIGSHRVRAKSWWDDIDELSSWISSVEEDGKGVPILLKQYLKLGGKFLCFSLDHRFSKALDGLFLVDLTHTDQKVLMRYMGIEGFNTFTKYHMSSDIDFISLKKMPLDAYANV